MEDQQDISDQIAVSNCKLQLLQKTQEIEEKEGERLLRNAQKRTDKANLIRSKNATISSHAQSEIMFRGEEAERREVIEKVKQYASEFGLTSVVKLLDKFEGIYIYLFNYFIIFIYLYLYICIS